MSDRAGLTIEERDRYYLEFGRFMNEFATVETLVHILFRRVSGMDHAAAKIISGSMTLAQLMSATRGIVKAREMEESTINEVEATLSHLADIASLRNALVHRGAERDGDEFVASDRFTTKSSESYKKLQFNIEDIRAAHRDCTVLFYRIRRIFLPVPPNEDDPFVLQAIREPWKYRHRPSVKTDFSVR